MQSIKLYSHALPRRPSLYPFPGKANCSSTLVSVAYPKEEDGFENLGNLSRRQIGILHSPSSLPSSAIPEKWHRLVKSDAESTCTLELHRAELRTAKAPTWLGQALYRLLPRYWAIAVLNHADHRDWPSIGVWTTKQMMENKKVFPESENY